MCKWENSLESTCGRGLPQNPCKEKNRWVRRWVLDADGYKSLFLFMFIFLMSLFYDMILCVHMNNMKSLRQDLLRWDLRQPLPTVPLPPSPTRRRRKEYICSCWSQLLAEGRKGVFTAPETFLVIIDEGDKRSPTLPKSRKHHPTAANAFRSLMRLRSSNGFLRLARQSVVSWVRLTRQCSSKWINETSWCSNRTWYCGRSYSSSRRIYSLHSSPLSSSSNNNNNYKRITICPIMRVTRSYLLYLVYFYWIFYLVFFIGSICIQ